MQILWCSQSESTNWKFRTMYTSETQFRPSKDAAIEAIIDNSIGEKEEFSQPAQLETLKRIFF